jgi:thiamine-phosphate pyrophosphorylase
VHGTRWRGATRQRRVAVHDSASLTLIAIADTLRDGLEELVVRSLSAVQSGATAVHLRLKGEDSRTMLDACRALVAALPVPVIVYDRADVAVAARAAGVHLSREEMPTAVVRGVVREGMLVGASVGSAADLELARDADYVSIGPVFARGARASDASAMGVDEFARLARMVGVPVVAVGGIAADNARLVLAAGAAGVAVITGAYAKAEATQAIRELRAAIGT